MTLPDLAKPVACTLTNAQTRARRALVRDTVLPKIINYGRVENGLTLSFANAPNIRADVQEFVRLEQGCCGFLSFDLSAAENAPLTLIITGADDAQSTIDTMFNIVEAATNVYTLA